MREFKNAILRRYLRNAVAGINWESQLVNLADTHVWYDQVTKKTLESSTNRSGAGESLLAELCAALRRRELASTLRQHITVLLDEPGLLKDLTKQPGLIQSCAAIGTQVQEGNIEGAVDAFATLLVQGRSVERENATMIDRKHKRLVHQEEMVRQVATSNYTMLNKITCNNDMTLYARALGERFTNLGDR